LSDVAAVRLIVLSVPRNSVAFTVSTNAQFPTLTLRAAGRPG
jgi:hypothetical protein